MAQITEVLQKLIVRTNAGKVPWKPTSEEQTFVAVLGNNSAMILLDNVNDPVLKILNSSGAEIEILDGGVNDAYRRELSALQTEARRQALGIAQTLDELIGELEAGEVDDLPF